MCLVLLPVHLGLPSEIPLEEGMKESLLFLCLNLVVSSHKSFLFVFNEIHWPKTFQRKEGRKSNSSHYCDWLQLDLKKWPIVLVLLWRESRMKSCFECKKEWQTRHFCCWGHWTKTTCSLFFCEVSSHVSAFMALLYGQQKRFCSASLSNTPCLRFRKRTSMRKTVDSKSKTCTVQTGSKGRIRQ